MKIITCALAVFAAVSTAAVARELKQDKTAPSPTVKAQVMSDADMDKVTAGDNYHAAVGNCCYYVSNYAGQSHTVNYHAYYNGFRGN